MYTYILKCSDGSLYTGWTNNLSERLKTHNEGKGAKYTRGRLPVTLVYFEEFKTAQDAMKREYAIKKLTRSEKILLISEKRLRMKIISWNINGLRAGLKKGFMETFSDWNADVVCLQETKMEKGQAELDLTGYEEFWNSAEKKGYSGTAIFSKAKPKEDHNGMGMERHDKEGRVITLEYPDFYLVNCYTPNSQRGLLRLDYRMEWEEDFKAYLLELDKKKPVILCGDLNVAHTEIDIKNAAANRKNAGFTDDEREKMTNLLESGFTDSFRALYPDRQDGYTWWSYMGSARERNVGWRIDYFIVSNRFMDRVEDIIIHQNIMGSDHCPIELRLKY